MEDLMKATSTHFSGFVLEDQPSSTTTVKDSQKEPFVIGVSGGTAAGKTTICNMIISQLRDQRVALVNQDLFYRVLNEEELRQAHDYNFDSPDSFDMDCLLDCMTMLKQRKSVDIPSFNHKLHQRCAPVRKVNPSDVIILEGILVFHDLRLCKLMNMKIFVDTDDDVRLGRRIRRNRVQDQDLESFLVKIKGMSTLLHNSKFSKNGSVAYVDQLIHLVVEHGLSHLSFTKKKAISPTGSPHAGVEFCEKVCCVSIIRSGESMENALQECCKGIKMCKISIHGDDDKGEQLMNEHLPKDISNYHLLLLDPVLATGNSAVQAIQLLLERGVQESNIIFLNLISSPRGIHTVCKKFPGLRIVTLEIDMALNEEFRVTPTIGEFGGRRFGREDGSQTTFNSTANANGTDASF